MVKAEPISALLLLYLRFKRSPGTLNFLAHLRLTILRKLNFGDFIHVGVLNGSPTGARSAYQTITVNAPQSTTFMLTGWARANSVDIVPEDGITTDAAKANRKFGMRATLTYSNGSTEEHYVSFNPDVTAWQYASLAIVPQTTNTALTVKSIKVAVVYEYNANTMYFDDICLTVEPAQTYVYDENGNLKSATDIEGNDSLLNYAENNIDLETFTTVTGDRYTYEYYETHDIKSAERTLGEVTQKLEYEYDDYGNPDKTTLTATGTSEKFTSSAVYSEYGTFLTKVTDSLGHATTYNYDTATKLLKFIEDANSRRTGYKYDNRSRTTNVYLDADEDGELDEGVEPAVEYIYAQNRYSNIKTASTTYTLTYDTFGNLKTIKAGNKTLATYSYAANNGKLTSLTYGNGDYETYTYDHLDRLTKVVYNGVADSGYELFYDANGRLFQTIDREAGITHTYEYDSLGRLIRAWQKNSSTGSVILGVENSYDSYGRASGSTYVIGDTAQNYGITYKEISGLLDTYTTPHNSFTYSYDNFDRLTRKLGDKYYISYTYVAGSQRVNTYTISQADYSSLTYAYTYDNLGNITSVKKNGTTVSNYEYDKLGRLIREDDCANNVSWVYTYDNAGNLLKKYTFYGMVGVPAVHLVSTHPYNGSEISSTYTYSTSEWGDLLTNYNGTAITYDAIGNPLKWRNATSMSWDKRSLQGMTLSNGTTLSFAYNADGIRTQKYCNNNSAQTTYVHNYILDGSTILGETISSVTAGGSGTTTLYYYYDESGISGVSYNGVNYSYIRNLQGDVISIINSNGVTVVEYKYDAWGNILSVTGSLASTLGTVNPFRYRGYYYDTETGFYYLNSRYYDPQAGRFLNADSIVAGISDELSGYNLFVYCFNNPVNMSDYDGNWPDWLKKAVKSVATYIDNIVTKVQNSLEGVNMTYSKGVSGSFSPEGVVVNGQAGWSADTSGNIALQFTLASGFTTGDAGCSVSEYRTITNAPSVKHLEELGCSLGGSVVIPVDGVPLMAGGDILFIPDEHTTYFGVSTNFGLSTPVEETSLEMHAEISKTVTVVQINIFSTIHDAYEKIMEW